MSASALRRFRRVTQAPIPITVHRRQITADVQRIRSVDELPGTFELAAQQDVIRAATDSVNFFNEKYDIARRHDVSSPMMKMNLRGMPSVALLSHDAVKECFQQEIQLKIRRGNSTAFSKLLGRPFNEMAGPNHSAWRKKVKYVKYLVTKYTYVHKTGYITLQTGCCFQSRAVHPTFSSKLII